jgi:hypothetical protein
MVILPNILLNGTNATKHQIVFTQGFKGFVVRGEVNVPMRRRVAVTIADEQIIIPIQQSNDAVEFAEAVATLA